MVGMRPPAGAALDAAVALERRELAVSDPVQPRGPRAPLGRVPIAALERGGERLGRQVGGELRVAGAPVEERDDAAHVAVVEARERGRSSTAPRSRAASSCSTSCSYATGAKM